MKVKAYLEYEDGTTKFLHETEVPFEKIESTLGYWDIDPALKYEDKEDGYTHVTILKSVWDTEKK